MGEVRETLLVGSFRSPVALEWAYLRSFRRLGVARVETFEIAPADPAGVIGGIPGRIASRLWSEWDARRAGKRLADFIAYSDCKFDLILVFKGVNLGRKELEEARRSQPQAVWANINPDDPFNSSTRGSSSPDVLESLSFYDVYFTWSRSLVKQVAEKTHKRTAYLPFGYDPESHHSPRGVVPEVSETVCFIGSWDEQREELLSQLTDFKLVILGSAWNRLKRRSALRRFVAGGAVGGEDFCRPIAMAAACLNILRPQNRGAHNMRTFEIPAAGGLMVTSRTGEQEGFFPDGDASFMFDDVAELRERLRTCLKDRALASRVRERGRARVAEHSYDARARSVLAEIEALGGGIAR